MIPYPYKIEDAYAFVRLSRNAAKWKKLPCILLGIELKEEDAIVGGIGINRINRRMKSAEIGCWIGKPYRGQGLMTEAMVAVLRYAFSTLGLKRVYAHVFVENKASRKLVERCGFTREGCLRASHLHRRRWRTTYLYSILREEYPRAILRS